MSNPISIIPSRVPFLDPRTGDISRAWYLLILNLVNRLGGTDGQSTDDLAIGTLTGNSSPSLEGLLQALEKAQGSQPVQSTSFAIPNELLLQPAVPYYGIDDVTPVNYAGDLGNQNADRVKIAGGTIDNVKFTGGSVDGTPVGATTANSGKFTTLAVTGNAGFFNTAPIAKPTVAGSRGGNVALASLITALANLGLVTDTTTA